MTTDEMDTLVSYVITIYDSRGRQIDQRFAETYRDAVIFERTYRGKGYHMRFEMLPR